MARFGKVKTYLLQGLLGIVDTFIFLHDPDDKFCV